jgi:hypothetical protein
MALDLLARTQRDDDDEEHAHRGILVRTRHVGEPLR